MSIDRSLRMKSSLERHRNVLARAERVVIMQGQERWTEESSPLHLPKVSHRKVKASKKAKKEEAATTEAAAATGTTPAAPAAAPAAAAKGPAAKAPAGKTAAAPKK